MKTFSIDFETYYDPAFSLKKLSTEDYVFGALFEIICVSVRTDTGNVEVFSGTEEATRQFLLQFDLHENAVLAHNCRFDGLILARLGIFPRFYLDSLGMARPLYGSRFSSLSLDSLTKHLKLGTKGDEVIRALGKRREDFTPQELHTYTQYCANDAVLTYKLYRFLRDQFPKDALADELRVIDQTLRMYLQPTLRLDQVVLEANLAEVKERKATILSELEVQGVTGSVLRSNDKFAALLRERGVEPPMKISKKKTEKAGHTVMGYAFSKQDPEFIELQEEFEDDLDITMLLNGRLSEKSTQEETRTTKFIFVAKLYGLLRVALAYYKAHTGRYGGDEGMNMQNPPRVDKSKMRFAILPPPDHDMIVADLAQIEARITALLAGQLDLVEAFANGLDVYYIFATDLYGTPSGYINKKSDDPDVKSKRFVGKESILGLGFGMGPKRFKNALRGKGKLTVPLETVEQYVAFYRTKYAFIKKLWDTFDFAFRQLLTYDKETQIGPVRVCFGDNRTPRILGPNGLSLWYPKLKYHGYEWTFQRPQHKVPQKIFGGMWVENTAQFLANIIIKQKMLRVTKELHLPPRLQAHDAIGWVTPKEDTKMYAKRIEAIMAEPPVWWPDLPVAAEVKTGATYGDV